MVNGERRTANGEYQNSESRTPELQTRRYRPDPQQKIIVEDEKIGSRPALIKPPKMPLSNNDEGRKALSLGAVSRLFTSFLRRKISARSLVARIAAPSVR